MVDIWKRVARARSNAIADVVRMMDTPAAELIAQQHDSCLLSASDLSCSCPLFNEVLRQLTPACMPDVTFKSEYECGKSFSTFHVPCFHPFDENALYTASLQSSSFGIFPPSQLYPQASASHLHAPTRHLLRIAEVPLQRSRCGHAAYVACSTSASPPHLHGPALAGTALTGTALTPPTCLVSDMLLSHTAMWSYLPTSNLSTVVYITCVQPRRTIHFTSPIKLLLTVTDIPHTPSPFLARLAYAKSLLRSCL